MKQPDCRCHLCRPAKPAQASILLPRVIASGRTWLRRCPCALRVDSLPECIPGPLTLLHVIPCGDASWTCLPCTHPRQMLLQVSVPLSCTVRDACGTCHTGHACIEAELCLNLTCPACECWRSNAAVFPQVRLVCAPCSSNCCFNTQLEILIDGYLLRWECCASPLPCKPQCPDLPLYPQPCVPPCH